MTRARLLPVLAAALLLGAPSLRAGTADLDLLPGGTVLSTLFPASEVEEFRVAAPAGSLLLVDLRPSGRSGLLPSLEATLADGSEAPPAPPRRGRIRALLPFPADGTCTLRVGSGNGGAGDYRLRTRLKAPRGALLEGVVPEEGSAEVAFHAPPGCMASLKAAAAPGSGLVPRLSSVEGPGGSAAPGRVRSGPRTDSWSRVLLGALGPWTLSVRGEAGSSGPFLSKVRWRVPRGGKADLRDAPRLEALLGPYAAFLASVPEGPLPIPGLLTGGLDFDGRGGIRAELSAGALVPDLASPLGFGLQFLPVPGRRGSYWTDGSRAALSLPAAGGATVEASFTMAAGGSILHAGIAEPGSDFGLLLERGGPPTAAALAGTWFYADVATGGGGPGTVEIGALTLSAGGGVTGIGARTALEAGGGAGGGQTPVFRTGSFTVAADGTVTVRTVPNLFGAQETWTASLVFRQDILVGLGEGAFPAGGARLLLRQGTGLDTADVSGNYLHLGVFTGADTGIRSGVLTFDGAGRFSGTGTVLSLSGGGSPGAGVPVAGSYAVNGSGIATLSFDGGTSGTGIAGPDAAYLLAVSLGAGGVGLDVLFDLGE